jgi:outer membrane protein OmpA-like peptidoglycan-associated protein
MKKLQLLILLILLSFASYSQTYQNGWGLGFGVSSPRMFGDVASEFFDFGAHVSLNRYFDQFSSLRVKLDYLNFTSSRVVTPTPPSTKSYNIGFDYLYGISVCYPVKIYVGTGISLLFFKVKNAQSPAENGNVNGELGINFIGGAKYSIGTDWDLHVEFAFHQTSTDRYDGVYAANGGLFGGTLDSYVTSELGFIYYFQRGPATNFCDLPQGITNVYNQAPATVVDYEKIRAMIDTSKADLIAKTDKKLDDLLGAKSEKNAPCGAALVGINFNVNKAEIKPENYAILAQDASVLLANPDMKVEISGYADIDGAEKANIRLSERRAESVKNYLVAKGVEPSRLIVKAYGESFPISENKFYNRRVDFKLIK